MTALTDAGQAARARFRARQAEAAVHRYGFYFVSHFYPGALGMVGGFDFSALADLKHSNDAVNLSLMWMRGNKNIIVRSAEVTVGTVTRTVYFVASAYTIDAEICNFTLWLDSEVSFAERMSDEQQELLFVTRLVAYLRQAAITPTCWWALEPGVIWTLDEQTAKNIQRDILALTTLT